MAGCRFVVTWQNPIKGELTNSLMDNLTAKAVVAADREVDGKGGR